MKLCYAWAKDEGIVSDVVDMWEVDSTRQGGTRPECISTKGSQTRTFAMEGSQITRFVERADAYSVKVNGIGCEFSNH